MKAVDPEIIFMELKYCERCGGLWLRRQGAAQPYCAPCSLELMDLPAPQTKVRRPRIPGNHHYDSRLRGPRLVEEGGQA